MAITLKPDELQGGSSQGVPSVVARTAQNDKKAEQGCGDSVWQQLTPCQIQTLAQKVYALLLDELRIEAERHGRVLLR
jgi:hypothetical protein